MSFCEVSQIIVRLIKAKLFQPFHAYLQTVYMRTFSTSAGFVPLTTTMITPLRPCESLL